MKMYFIRLHDKHVRTVKDQLTAVRPISIIEASILGADYGEHRKDEPMEEHTLLIASFYETTNRLQEIIDACKLLKLVASVRVYQAQEEK